MYFDSQLKCFQGKVVHRYLIGRLQNNYFLNSDRRLIYFMDDDLLDWRALIDIPLPYAFRLWSKATSKRKVILSRFTELLVSTHYLADKYSAFNPKLLRPIASGPLLDRLWHPLCPSTSLTSSRYFDPVRICYHGTWSHRDDIKWVAPVIADVQRSCPNTVFEVIGDYRIARIFEGIPRVSVLPTMSWSKYLQHTQTVHQDIGLAPLRDTLFNRGRGSIKFFDYARSGAVGVYSTGPAYSNFVTNDVDGFVLNNDRELWVKKIIELVRHPRLRKRMADNAWLKVLDNSPTSPEIKTYLKDLNNLIATPPNVYCSSSLNVT